MNIERLDDKINLFEGKLTEFLNLFGKTFSKSHAKHDLVYNGEIVNTFGF